MSSAMSRITDRGSKAPFSPQGFQAQAVVVCHEPRQSLSLLSRLTPSATLIALDGAADLLWASRHRPDIIVGDLDSVRAETLARARQEGVEVVYRPDPMFCDLEKALDLCVERGLRRVALVGLLGGRADYTLANAVILLRYIDKLTLLGYEPDYWVVPLIGRIAFASYPGQPVSLIPWGQSSSVTIKGMQYNVSCEAWPSGRVGVSNISQSELGVVDLATSAGFLFLGYPSVGAP